MSLRFVEAEPLVSWLHQLLDGAPLQAIHHPDPETLVLRFRLPGETIHLLLATGSGRSRLHTVERPPPAPAAPHAFQGLLRKHLRGRLTELSLLERDRVVRLRLSDADGPTADLVAELTDRHGNFFLVERDGHILGAAQRSSSKRRNLAGGQLWEPPAARSGPTEDRYAPLDGSDRDLAIRARYGDLDQGRGELVRRHALQRMIRGRLKGLTRLLERQELEAERGEEADRLRQEGDLLRTSFHRLQRGQDELSVPDLFAADGATRRLVLDPALTPAQQVEARYKAAKRAERSAEQAGARAARTCSQVEELLALQARCDAEGGKQLEAVIADLPANLQRRWSARDPDHRAPHSARRGDARARATRLPYRSYRSPSGHEIRVGRGARDNDELTLKIARGNDLFLHVRGRPGAHVIVCNPGKAPTPELLRLAGQLAMAHSGVAGGDRAEVLWTRVKDVRKPKGMAPGAVLLRSEKVLYLEADRRVLDALEAETPR